jgi:integrase
MKAATDAKGRPTFAALQPIDKGAPPPLVPRGAVPNFHSFRHTAASEAIAAGDGAEEVSWQLGHRNSNVTRSVYVQEIKSAERSAKRRGKLEARYRELLQAEPSRGSRSSAESPHAVLAVAPDL